MREWERSHLLVPLIYKRMRKVSFAGATLLLKEIRIIQAADTTHRHRSHRHILHTINLGKNIPWGLYVLTCQNLGGRCIILYICTPLHIPLWHPYCSQAKLASNIIPLCYYAQPPNIHTLSKLQIHFSSLSLVKVLTPFTSCPEYNTWRRVGRRTETPNTGQGWRKGRPCTYLPLASITNTSICHHRNNKKRKLQNLKWQRQHQIQF